MTNVEAVIVWPGAQTTVSATKSWVAVRATDGFSDVLRFSGQAALAQLGDALEGVLATIIQGRQVANELPVGERVLFATYDRDSQELYLRERDYIHQVGMEVVTDLLRWLAHLLGRTTAAPSVDDIPGLACEGGYALDPGAGEHSLLPGDARRVADLILRTISTSRFKRAPFNLTYHCETGAGRISITPRGTYWCTLVRPVADYEQHHDLNLSSLAMLALSMLAAADREQAPLQMEEP